MAEISQSGFGVDGMFCGGCAATVERALTRVQGVESASVSFVSDAALVRHDDRVDRDTLAEVIRRLGYGVRSLAEDGQPEASDSRDAFLRWHRIRLAVAICFGMWTMLASMAIYIGQIPTQEMAWVVALVSGGLAAPVILFSGSAFYKLGWRSVRVGAPGMETLITVAVVAAVAVSIINLMRGVAHVYFDAAVMLITFQLIARLTDFSVRRSAGDAVRRLLQLAPEQARRIAQDRAETVHPRALEPSDVIEIRPGERISADGTIATGIAKLDSSLITGESMPKSVKPGSDVSAGELVLDGVLTVSVEAPGGKRRIDALATEVRRLIVGKGTLARLADQVARWLLPVIVVSAIFALTLALATGADWQTGISRALAVMIVTCPCALSLAVPLVVTAAASAGARRGVILRDPGALEKASRLNIIMLDKTGTVTAGRPEVVAVDCAPGISRDDVLKWAARAERGSLHPLARAICRTVENNEIESTLTDVREIAGYGMEARTSDGSLLRVGSASWLRDCGITPHASRREHASAVSSVEVALDDRALGSVALADPLRAESAHVIKRLKKRGYTVILASGDGEAPVQAIAETLGIEAYAQLKPGDKLDLIRQAQAKGDRVAFVGDGLNDGPALAAADLGIAVGDANDLARSAAAVGLLETGMKPVETALLLTHRAGRVLRQNLVWALAYNGLIIPAAILGYVHPLLAAVAMAASSMSVSLNAMRAGWLPGQRGSCMDNDDSELQDSQWRVMATDAVANRSS